MAVQLFGLSVRREHCTALDPRRQSERRPTPSTVLSAFLITFLMLFIQIFLFSRPVCGLRAFLLLEHVCKYKPSLPPVFTNQMYCYLERLPSVNSSCNSREKVCIQPLPILSLYAFCTEQKAQQNMRCRCTGSVSAHHQLARFPSEKHIQKRSRAIEFRPTAG